MRYACFFLSLIFLVLACKDSETTSHKYTNALVDETSPYLLQHAHNPVNWYPWGEEALDKAEEEDKLVLVSIGYSSCHWCHVMEEETFEDEEVAKLMNDNFVNIKVDREERPDVDQVYMTALQLLTGSGGWPLNVITLPNGKPIYGGTYHTKEEWMQVLDEISTLYRDSPERAREYADKVAQGIRSVNLVEKPERKTSVNTDFVDRVLLNWKRTWDTINGGQNGPQKFMLPPNLNAILNYGELAADKAAKTHLKHTLDRMARGGVYDQLAGGFYRYSTDSEWKVPHFEKMLYDNAQMIGVYSRAYRAFKNPDYQNVVASTLRFLDREMKHPEGAYYAALDADSEGEEGKFYTWTSDELKSVLGGDYDTFAAYYNIRPEEAWEAGKYILHRPVSDSVFLGQNGLGADALKNLKNSWHERLLQAREKRVRPGLDDKVITSWNALMISGLSEAYKAFGDNSYRERAESVYAFLQEYNTRKGKLVHTYKEGSKQEEGFLEDYAYMLDAAIDLYAVTMDESYLEDGRAYLAHILENYPDENSMMFRFRDDDALISAIIKTDDGVLPSPNAVIADNLIRLGHFEYKQEYIERADAMMEAVIPNLERSPDLYGKWISNVMSRAYPYYEVAVVGPSADELMKEFAEALYPNALLLGTTTESEQPLFQNRFVSGETFIYVCQNHSCKLPVTSVAKAVQLMK